MSETNCPLCGGVIRLEPGANPTQSSAQSSAQLAQNPAQTEIAHVSRSKDLSPKRKSYNRGYDPVFLAFWEVYPLKRDKRKAQIAWRNAIARADATAIANGAIRYRDDPNRLPSFTKYAEGWLNGDGWEDEPLPPRLTPNGRRPEPARPLTSGEMDRYLKENL